MLTKVEKIGIKSIKKQVLRQAFCLLLNFIPSVGRYMVWVVMLLHWLIFAQNIHTMKSVYTLDKNLRSFDWKPYNNFRRDMINSVKEQVKPFVVIKLLITVSFNVLEWCLF